MTTREGAGGMADANETSASLPAGPRLDGDARRAVRHRGSHVQIIACAGSGKTEVVAQRVADLFAGGVDPAGLVAFTFTERAADSLKTRIEIRIVGRPELGHSFLDRLNGAFVGTIHSYCFRLLQLHCPRYETYDVLDEHRLAAFLTREERSIGFRALSPSNKLFEALRTFVANVDVVDNELVSLDRLHDPFREMVERFRGCLEQYRFLTYGQLVARAVEELRRPEVFAAVHGRLRHLIVDEYQDINPAQESLIARLAAAPVELCVVGDDDQSIYQWRGSDVGNIVTFQNRYRAVTTFDVTRNRRSRPAIIEHANGFARTIAGRLPKEMLAHRESAGPEVVPWRAATEADEASTIATTIQAMHAQGYRYRDIAVLVRSSTSYARLLEAFAHHAVPVQPGSRTALFLTDDAQRFGRTFAYLAGNDWRSQAFGWGSPVTLADLVDDYARGFHLDAPARHRVEKRLQAWRVEADAATRPANLVRDYYDLLAECAVETWDLADPALVARLGALARCSTVLADYESVRRRSRPDPNQPGGATGGQDRGEWYYRWLAIHIQNWALGEFEGFEGEDDANLDAVDLTTVHQAKGLEWPVVFVPCVSAKRFPSSYTGRAGTWHIPRECFDATRYEGTENDERRLFYVAVTRARDWLSVSTHDAVNRNSVRPSPFLLQFAGGVPPGRTTLPLPPAPVRSNGEDQVLSLTFSDLASYANCGLAYRLRALIGFQPALAPELGYGKAVHHVMRRVAEHTQRHGRPPTARQLDRLFDDDFYLPAANKAAHAQLKAAARRLVDTYIAKHEDDLLRVWEVERPFELHLGEAVVTGRADVILDREGGQISALAIVDYKTATDPVSDYDTQLQVYTDAGRREGLDVTAAYVHDLRAADRIPVDVGAEAVERTEDEVRFLVGGLKARRFDPKPAPDKCARCDVRAMCGSRAS